MTGRAHEDRRHDRARRHRRPETLAALIDGRAWTARGSTSRTATHERPRASARSSSARREAAAGRPIALIADLQGPKLRVGDLDSEVELARTAIGRDRGRRRRPRPPTSPLSPAVNRVGAAAGQRRAHRRREWSRLRVDRVERGRARCDVIVGWDGCRAQAHQPARHSTPPPFVDAQGSRRPRARAPATARLRRPVVRAVAGGRDARGARRSRRPGRIRGDREDRAAAGGGALEAILERPTA